MCLTREIVAGVIFGLVPLCATLFVLLSTQRRADLAMNAKAWRAILFKSFLLMFPFVLGVGILQKWFGDDGHRRLCMSWPVVFAVAFAGSMIWMICGVAIQRIGMASGVDVIGTYRGRWVLSVFVFALIFLGIRIGIHVLWP